MLLFNTPFQLEQIAVDFGATPSSNLFISIQLVQYGCTSRRSTPNSWETPRASVTIPKLLARKLPRYHCLTFCLPTRLPANEQPTTVYLHLLYSSYISISIIINTRPACTLFSSSPRVRSYSGPPNPSCVPPTRSVVAVPLSNPLHPIAYAKRFRNTLDYRFALLLVACKIESVSSCLIW